MDSVKYEYAMNVLTDFSEFEEACDSMLAMGWQCQGGVSIAVEGATYSYAQAFVREVPREGDE